MGEQASRWGQPETYIAAVTALAGAIPASGVFPADSVWNKVAGLVVVVFAALGYRATQAAKR